MKKIPFECLYLYDPPTPKMTYAGCRATFDSPAKSPSFEAEIKELTLDPAAADKFRAPDVGERTEFLAAIDNFPWGEYFRGLIEYRRDNDDGTITLGGSFGAAWNG